MYVQLSSHHLAAVPSATVSLTPSAVCTPTDPPSRRRPGPTLPVRTHLPSGLRLRFGPKSMKQFSKNGKKCSKKLSPRKRKAALTAPTRLASSTLQHRPSKQQSKWLPPDSNRQRWRRKSSCSQPPQPTQSRKLPLLAGCLPQKHVTGRAAAARTETTSSEQSAADARWTVKSLWRLLHPDAPSLSLSKTWQTPNKTSGANSTMRLARSRVLSAKKTDSQEEHGVGVCWLKRFIQTTTCPSSRPLLLSLSIRANSTSLARSPPLPSLPFLRTSAEIAAAT